MSKKQFVEPLNERIMVQRLDGLKDMSEGGIILPTTVYEIPNIAKVISIGKGVDKELFDIKIGDTVVLMPQTGYPVEIDNEKFDLLEIYDVIGVFRTEN